MSEDAKNRPNIADVQNVNNRSKEHMGYPTQKPLKLLDRLIRASSNPGDMVLDPFCGCATALIAAETHGHVWADYRPVPAGRQAGGPAVPGSARRLRPDHCPDRHSAPDRPRSATEPPDHTLYGAPEGRYNGCRVHFPFHGV